MLTKIARWGNSIAVRIPAELIRKSGLQEGQTVEINADGKALVIKPAQRLEDLLKGITPNNLHAEQNAGEPKGKEIW